MTEVWWYPLATAVRVRGGAAAARAGKSFLEEDPFESDIGCRRTATLTLQALHVFDAFSPLRMQPDMQKPEGAQIGQTHGLLKRGSD